MRSDLWAWNRRQALWAIRGLSDTSAAAVRPLPIATPAEAGSRRTVVTLPAMTAGREVVEDYRAVGLSLRASSGAFLRATCAAPDHRAAPT